MPKSYVDFRQAKDHPKMAFKNAVREAFYDVPDDELDPEEIVAALKELIREWS